MLDLVPAARVAHIGLYRDPETKGAVEYYLKTPADLAARQVIVVSPVVATANTAVAAIDRLKERGASDIRVVCMIASPEGVERLRGIHPDVKLWTAAIDDHLDGNAFIVPGPRRRRKPRLRHGIAADHTRRRRAVRATAAGFAPRPSGF